MSAFFIRNGLRLAGVLLAKLVTTSAWGEAKDMVLDLMSEEMSGQEKHDEVVKHLNLLFTVQVQKLPKEIGGAVLDAITKVAFSYISVVTGLVSRTPTQE